MISAYLSLPSLNLESHVYISVGVYIFGYHLNEAKTKKTKTYSLVTRMNNILNMYMHTRVTSRFWLEFKDLIISVVFNIFKNTTLDEQVNFN
jgi:hypothetical protein